MTLKSLDFKCALVTGGAGGLGRAMAEHLIKHGKKIIIAGRTESKLKTAAKELGDLSYYVLDTGDIASIPGFVKQITSDHPELDCLINNAGVQRPLDVNKMKAEEFLEKADNEISINIRGPMHLAMELLPHFKSKPGAVIMNVTSVLGYIPFSVINPVYNATKAWFHFWSMNLRTQLEQGGANIRVIEIVPPQVESDLHRERENPDDNKKTHSKTALSVDEFMHDVNEGWKSNDNVVSAGPGKKIISRWHDEFGPDYEKAIKGR